MLTWRHYVLAAAAVTADQLDNTHSPAKVAMAIAAFAVMLGTVRPTRLQHVHRSISHRANASE